MRKYKYIVLIFYLFVIVSTVFGEDKIIKATVLPIKGTVGQVFKYKISIGLRDGDKVSIKLPEKKIIFPKKNSKKINNKKDKDSSKSDSEKYVPLYIIHDAQKESSGEGNVKQLTVTMDLACYRPGTHELPELSIQDSKGISIGYKIPSITVGASNKDGKEVDIEGPLSLGGNYNRLFILIASLVALSIILFFIVRFFIRYLKSRKIKKNIPPLDLFLRGVEKMNPEETIKGGHINNYVFGISALFRKYFSDEFSYDALEMTTDEIASSMGKGLPEFIISKFGNRMLELMRFWDFSKFAEYSPTEEKLLENYNLSVELIKNMAEAVEREATSDRT